MKLLFTHSYFLTFDVKQIHHGQPYPPLGTILAASLLRQNNYDVALFDTMFCENPLEIEKELINHKPDILVVYDDGFNYLTKMCLSNMREAAFKMQEIAKKYGCKIIVTSSDAADNAELYLTNFSDFVIIGEGEYTLLELVNALKQKQTDFTTIKGLTYFKEQELIKTAPRAVSKALDELPLPAWDLINIIPYKNKWAERNNFFAINLATTRGCPYKCNWCAKPIYGNTYNMRSVEHVIAEIKLVQKLFNTEYVWFADDIFGLKRSWVEEFASKIAKEKITIKYKIQSRADLLVQEKYVDDLAKSGCYEVWMGAESGAQKILDAMDKGTKVEEIVNARKLLKHHKIKAAYFLQFGYLGETMDDIKATINMVKTTLPSDIGISVSYPLPHTKFYENVKADLVTKTNWTHSDDLALLFKNTYQPQFYKQLHRYVHSVYRREQGIVALKNILSFKIDNEIPLKRFFALPKTIYQSIVLKNILKKLEKDAATSL